MSKDYREHIEHTFDAYCKRVLRNEAFDYYASLERRRSRELPLEDYQYSLCTEDDYFSCQDVFIVKGLAIEIRDTSVSMALRTLSQEKRDIVLLTCCVGLADRIVAEMVDTARRTVSYRRAVALKELRSVLRNG